MGFVPDIADGSRRKYVTPRIAGFVAAGVAAVVIVLAFVPARTEPVSPSGTTSTSTTTTEVLRSAPTARPGPTAATATPPSSPAAIADDRAAAKDGAARFLAAWMTPGDVPARTAALTPVASATLLNQIADVPASLLPQGPITKLDLVAYNGMAATALFTLGDGTNGSVGMVATAAGWKATTLTRVH